MSKERNKDIENIIEEKLDDLKEEFEGEIKEELIESIEENTDEINMLNSKIKELEDKVLRISAENINYRKRKDEEVSRLLKYSNEEIILEILPIIDNFERALSNNNQSEELKSYISGFSMIYASLISILERFEVKEIDAIDKQFDSNFHEGVLTDNISDKEDNIVLEVLLKGYMLKDRVLRPSMVKVNQK